MRLDFKLMGFIYQLQHFNSIEGEALVVKAKAINCCSSAILLESINLNLSYVSKISYSIC